jgi:hypothetical protein
MCLVKDSPWVKAFGTISMYKTCFINGIMTVCQSASWLRETHIVLRTIREPALSLRVPEEVWAARNLQETGIILRVKGRVVWLL